MLLIYLANCVNKEDPVMNLSDNSIVKENNKWEKDQRYASAQSIEGYVKLRNKEY